MQNSSYKNLAHGIVPVVQQRTHPQYQDGPQPHWQPSWHSRHQINTRPHSHTINPTQTAPASMFEMTMNDPALGSTNTVIQNLMKNGDVLNVSSLIKKTSTSSGKTLRSKPSDTAQLDNMCDFVGMYDFKEIIGEGHYGVVKKAIHVITKELVAVKQITKGQLHDELTKERLYLEIRVMKLLKHSHVISLYEVAETPNDLFLILEYAPGGDLYDYVEKEGAVPEKKAKKLFCQILSAVLYCHQLNVAHRDIKPENILFAEGVDVLKISDFGMSAPITKGDMMKTGCGTMAYSAPEILKGLDYNGPRVDVWSLGVTLYYMVCGRLPFDNPSPTENVTDIIEGNFELDHLNHPTRKNQTIKLSKKLKDLIKSMLTVDQNLRSTMDDIVEHPWLDNKFKKYYQEKGLSSLKLTPEEDIAVKKDVSALGLNMEQLEKDLTAGTNSHLVATYRLLADQKIRNRTQRLDESTRTVGGIGRQNTSNMGSPGVTQMVRINSSQDLSLSQNEDLHPILVEPSSGSLRARSCEDLSSTSLLALGTNRVEPSPAQVSSISMGSGFPFHSSNKNASRHNSLSNNAHSSIYSNQNAISQMTAQQNGDASPGLSFNRRRPQDGVLPAAFTMNRITTQSVPELRPSPAQERANGNGIMELSTEDIDSMMDDGFVRYDDSNLFAEDDEPEFEFQMPSFLKRRSISSLPCSQSMNVFPSNNNASATHTNDSSVTSVSLSPLPQQPPPQTALDSRKAVSIIREESSHAHSVGADKNTGMDSPMNGMNSTDGAMMHTGDMDMDDLRSGGQANAGCLGKNNNCCVIQ